MPPTRPPRAFDLDCPLCGAQPGERCRSTLTGRPVRGAHGSRARAWRDWRAPLAELDRDLDRERLAEAPTLALPSVVDGWVVAMIDGHVVWLARSTARELAGDLRTAAKRLCDEKSGDSRPPA